MILLQVHKIDFDDENNVINKTTFMHSDGELWHIRASTMSQNVIATVYSHSEFSYTVSVMRNVICSCEQRFSIAVTRLT